MSATERRRRRIQIQGPCLRRPVLVAAEAVEHAVIVGAADAARKRDPSVGTVFAGNAARWTTKQTLFTYTNSLSFFV